MFPFVCTTKPSGFHNKGQLSIVSSFLLGLKFNSCFPPSLKQSPALRGETSCFILVALLLKDLEHSLSHLLARPPPLSLPSSSPQVLSNLTLRKKWKVCGFAVWCVFFSLCVWRASVFSDSECTDVCSVCVSSHDSVCALFKPPVSEALQGSLCIIGDLLLSAHCIWQLWIGDCHADVLINDNHNWYLLIAKDEETGIAESLNDEHTRTVLHTWLCDYRVSMCLCLIFVCTYRPFLKWSPSNQPRAVHGGASCLPLMLIFLHLYVCVCVCGF